MTVPDDSSKRGRRTFVTQPTGNADRAEPLPTTGEVPGSAKIDGDLKEKFGVEVNMNSSNIGQDNDGSVEHPQVSDNADSLCGSQLLRSNASRATYMP